MLLPPFHISRLSVSLQPPSPMSIKIREATHAGAWYTNNPAKLSTQIDGWVNEASKAGVTCVDKCRVVIAPHAGLSFSGRTAAYAYAAANLSQYKRIIMLGPSHHVYLTTCALSPFHAYDTPLGELRVDSQVNDDLARSKAFTRMSRTVDEDEHSFEMHMPFIKKAAKEWVFGSYCPLSDKQRPSHDIKVVPILVGNLSQEQEEDFGRYLSKYIKDPETLFAISSDFSHWGSRFRYTYYRPSPQAEGRRLGKTDSVGGSEGEALIHESIAGLDHEAWDILRHALSNPHQTHTKWTDYLRKTGNTICGRHAFGVLLGALHHANLQYKGEVDWTHYSQSSKVTTSPADSSVSYSAGYMAF
ncbi:hypothetical protein E3P99_02935 [Wallemia hederae]|uniref:AmmeMemoRadiSam system protein B n=1 Tax=Wallemia hederae TaxID=1540922 RepID=A0A4T0FHA9_9BASI|nr:hypothetical protein E3P99_02935 [Wallemia hederae]